MAQDYEVREEFRSHSLSQLLDDQVLCFQGVGEIQAELLKQYFGIATVRDLANWTHFLWSLEIQELALHGGDLAHTPIRQIVQTAPPKFKVRERALDLTPEQFMLASIADLDGLTPAQDLALYDIFRITTIAQLAHNRIMLEARVIEYLEGQSRAAPSGEAVAEGVDSVLARPAATAAASAVQRITEERKASRDERLHAMESETRDHVRERLASLRERARGRALAVTGDQAARATSIAATGAASAGARRMETLRAPRERPEAAAPASEMGGRVAELMSRRTTVAAGVSHERGTLDESRTLGRAAEAGGSTAGAARTASDILASRAAVTGRAAGPTLSSRAASVLAARGAGAAAGARLASAEPGTGAPPQLGRSGLGGGTTYAGRADTGAAAARTAATARTATAAAAPTATPPSLATAPSRRPPPILLGAAAIFVIIVAGILYFALRGGTPPTPGTATQTAPPVSAPGAPGTAVQPGAPGTAPSVAAPGAAAPGTGTRIAGTTTVPQQGTAQTTAGAPGVAKTIHTVREGQSLWRISKRYYALGHDWPVIYKENQEQIDDPDLIFPKQQFRIPPKP